MTTIEGFVASQVFSFMAPLVLAFFPILASARAIAGAEERGTTAVLLGNPMPRWQLFGGVAMLCLAFSHWRVLAIAIPGAVLIGM